MSVTFACIFCGLRGHDPEKMEHHLFAEHHHRVGLDPTPSREEVHQRLDDEHLADWCGHEERYLVCNRCGEYQGDEPR